MQLATAMNLLHYRCENFTLRLSSLIFFLVLINLLTKCFPKDGWAIPAGHWCLHLLGFSRARDEVVLTSQNSYATLSSLATSTDPKEEKGGKRQEEYAECCRDICYKGM